MLGKRKYGGQRGQMDILFTICPIDWEVDLSYIKIDVSSQCYISRGMGYLGVQSTSIRVTDYNIIHVFVLFNT